jgi:hypothetical protein
MTTAQRNFVPPPRPPARRLVPARARRAIYRERDIGVGYGNSSGYASERRYIRDWVGQPRFRCG